MDRTTFWSQAGPFIDAAPRKRPCAHHGPGGRYHKENRSSHQDHSDWRIQDYQPPQAGRRFGSRRARTYWKPDRREVASQPGKNRSRLIACSRLGSRGEIILAKRDHVWLGGPATRDGWRKVVGRGASAGVIEASPGRRARQNSVRNINWILRGLLDPLILPKVAGVEMLAGGAFRIAWFNRLKASAQLGSSVRESETASPAPRSSHRSRGRAMNRPHVTPGVPGRNRESRDVPPLINSLPARRDDGYAGRQVRPLATGVAVQHVRRRSCHHRRLTGQARSRQPRAAQIPSADQLGLQAHRHADNAAPCRAAIVNHGHFQCVPCFLTADNQNLESCPAAAADGPSFRPYYRPPAHTPPRADRVCALSGRTR